jgi:hypothetical protein
VLGRTCPRCGRRLRSGTECPQCDTATAGAGAAATASATRVLIGTPRPPIARPVAPSARAALRRVAVGAGVGLAGSLFGLLVLLFLPFVAVSLVFGVDSISISAPSLELLFLLAVVQPLLGMVEALLFRSAFHELAGGDPGFASPAQLSLLLLFGQIAILLGSVVTVGTLYILIHCGSAPTSTLGPSNSVQLSCLPLGDLLLAGLLIGIGALVAFVGLVGVALGTWRMGSRAKSRTLQVGAVLLLIPYVSVVGYLAALVAAGRRLGPPAAPTPERTSGG